LGEELGHGKVGGEMSESGAKGVGYPDGGVRLRQAGIVDQGEELGGELLVGGEQALLLVSKNS
jgi:hypothetical protein